MWKREREFGYEQGYCLYSPVSSDDGKSCDDEDKSLEELSPRSFPHVGRRRTRRRAVALGSSAGVQGGGSSAGGPTWFQIP